MLPEEADTDAALVAVCTSDQAFIAGAGELHAPPLPAQRQPVPDRN